MPTENATERLCTSDHLVRHTYFSNTYRAELSTDQGKSEKDITKIAIPFDADKEQILKSRFKISDNELNAFYVEFAKSFKRESSILKTLQIDPSLKKHMVFYDQLEEKRLNSGAYIFYYASDPVQPLLDSRYIKNGTTNVLSILQIWGSLLKSAHIFSKIGIHIGAVDLDTLCVDNQDNILVGTFIYGSKDSEPSSKSLKTAPLSMLVCSLYERQ